MAASQPIEASLLQLLRCNICLDRQDQLKVLSCQHTICAGCAKKLPVKKNMFSCSVCHEDFPVPNGGLDNLPDSLITKQIADIIQQGRMPEELNGGGEDEPRQAVKNPKSESSVNSLISTSGGFGFVPSKKPNLSQKKGSRSKANGGRGKSQKAKNELLQIARNGTEIRVSQSAELVKLRDDLQKALESGQNWFRKADEVMDYYSKASVILPSHTQHSRDLIIGYQEKVVRLCQEKLKGLNKGTGDQIAEYEGILNKMRPNADQMRDAMRTVPDVVKKLSSKDCSSTAVAKAQQHLLDLTTLNKTVSKDGHAIEKFPMITTGESVRLKIWDESSGNDDVEALINDKVSFSSIGIFRGELIERIANPLFPWLPMERRRPMVIFPEKPDWVGEPDSLLKSSIKSGLPYEGDKVRVKASVTTPHFSWNGIRAKKSRGILREVQLEGPDGDLLICVKFPENEAWQGLYSEIELVPGCGLEIGDEVWVSRSIPEPSRGWAGVNGSSIGKVKSISGSKGQEEVTVDFAECKDWIGLASELELVRKPQQGDKVQVKLSVEDPLYGWNRITHDDVGVLVQDGAEDHYDYYDDDYDVCTAVVRFPKDPRWKCSASDIEPARYQPPTYSVNDRNGGAAKGETLSAQDFMFANMFSNMFCSE